MPGNEIEFKLVGMSFVSGYPANLLRLRDIMEEAKADDIGWGNEGDGDSGSGWHLPEGPLVLALYRNPENEYDENAIEVHCPMLGRDGMMGHVPRDLAAEVAPSIDRGDEWEAWLSTVLVDPSHDDKPGALVVLKCVQRSASTPTT